MKISIKESCVKFHSIVVAKINKLMMKTLLKNERISYIAMFHEIVMSDDIECNEDQCKLKDFICYIEYCVERGMKFISLDELLELPLSDAILDKVVLTFDDGFRGFYENAVPYLIKNNIPFTCFISTSMLNSEGYINVDELKILSGIEKCSIGMHSHDHILWRFEKNEELKNDYIKCKKILEEIVCNQPIYYAFPYGSNYAVSKKNIRTIREFKPAAILLTDQRKLQKRELRNPSVGLPRLDIAGYYRGVYKNKNKGLKMGTNK